jgi:CheY-like chemotaxis protein
MPGLRPARASVLVVEDDLALARTLIEALETADYRVWHAGNGHEARAYTERAWPDLILLDLLLPDVDGLVLCSLLKGITDVPIIRTFERSSGARARMRRGSARLRGRGAEGHGEPHNAYDHDVSGVGRGVPIRHHTRGVCRAGVLRWTLA